MRRRREHKFKLHNLLFIYIATTVIVTVVSFSKYVTTVSTDSTAKIAIMANSVSIDLGIPKDAYPGYETIYPIILSNEDEGKICEVTQKYIIKIKRDSFENIPIEFELYKDEYCTESVEKDENGYYIAEEFILDANQRQTNTHYLKIYWPEEYNDANLAFEIGYFTIDVISTQLD